MTPATLLLLALAIILAPYSLIAALVVWAGTVLVVAATLGAGPTDLNEGLPLEEPDANKYIRT